MVFIPGKFYKNKADYLKTPLPQMIYDHVIVILCGLSWHVLVILYVNYVCLNFTLFRYQSCISKLQLDKMCLLDEPYVNLRNVPCLSHKCPLICITRLFWYNWRERWTGHKSRMRPWDDMTYHNTLELTSTMQWPEIF